MRNRAGTSFLELIVVLALLGLLLGIAAPPALRWRDVLAVRAARDELAAGVATARATATAAGGAALILDVSAGVFWITTADGKAGLVTDVASRYGVRIEGADGLVEIRYDAVGIGRLSNRTLRFRRGRAEAGLVVSAYGRVRRW
ncbi:MAG: hypothetical protein KY466_07860 [Gemmatimonadetes bacterium]|nr:hypothetical protein [Gemmatimonadota bacterium]